MDDEYDLLHVSGIKTDPDLAHFEGDPTEGDEPASKRSRGEKRVTLSEDQEEAMVEWLIDNPVLYNRGLKEYRDPHTRAALWGGQGDEIGCTGEDLRLWFRGMRTRFGKLTGNWGKRVRKKLTDREKWIVDRFSFLETHITRVPSRQSTTFKFAPKTRSASATATKTSPAKAEVTTRAFVAASAVSTAQPSTEPSDEPMVTPGPSTESDRSVSPLPSFYPPSSNHNITRHSRSFTSPDSETLDRLLEHTNTIEGVSERLMGIVSSMEGRGNRKLAYGYFVASSISQLHDEVFHTFQHRCSDMLEKFLAESRAIEEQERIRAEESNARRDSQREDLEERLRRLEEERRDRETERGQIQQLESQQQQPPPQPLFPDPQVAGTSGLTSAEAAET